MGILILMLLLLANGERSNGRERQSAASARSPNDPTCSAPTRLVHFAVAQIGPDYQILTESKGSGAAQNVSFSADCVVVADNLLSLAIRRVETVGEIFVGGVESAARAAIGRFAVDARVPHEDAAVFQMRWWAEDTRIVLTVSSASDSSRVVVSVTNDKRHVHQVIEHEAGAPLHHELHSFSFTMLTEDYSFQIDDRVIFSSQRYPGSDLISNDAEVQFQLVVQPLLTRPVLMLRNDFGSEKKAESENDRCYIRKIAYYPPANHPSCSNCPGDCRYLWRNTMSCHDRRFFVMADGEPKWNRYHNLWSDNNLEFSTPIGLEIEYHERYCTTDACKARPYTSGAYYGIQSVTSGRLNVTVKSAAGRGVVTSIGFVRDPIDSAYNGSEVALHLPSDQNKHIYLRMERLVYRKTINQQKKITTLKQIPIAAETEHSEATNVYTIEWARSLVRVYRNGIVLYSTTDETPFTLMYPFIAVWVSKDEEWNIDSYSAGSPHKYSAVISEFSYTPLYSTGSSPSSFEIDCGGRSIDSIRAFFIISIVSTVILWSIGRRAWRYLKDCAMRRIYRPLHDGVETENEIEMTSRVIRQGEDEYEVRVRLAPGQTADDQWTIDFLEDMRTLIEQMERQGRLTGEGRATTVVPESRGISRDFLRRLPVRIYDPSQEKSGESCVICMGDYEAGDQLRTLPCFHVFHTTCVDGWLTSKGSCPVCKMDLNA